MNKTIFKNTFKQNWKLLLIFSFVLCLYQTVIISLIDPDDMEQVKTLYSSLGSFLGPFGIDVSAYTSPLNYTASTFFSVIILAFSMVFYAIQVPALIAVPVDNTSIVCTLAAPVKRSTFVITRGIYLIFAMLVLFIAVLASGSIMLSYYGEFDFAAYFELVAFTFVLCTAIAMLSYFLSAAFCGSKLATGLSVGVPIGMLIISMIGGLSEKTEWLKKITPFGWLDSVGIVTGEVDTLWMFLGLGSAIIVLLAAAVFVFNKKRLPV